MVEQLEGACLRNQGRQRGSHQAREEERGPGYHRKGREAADHPEHRIQAGC